MRILLASVAVTAMGCGSQPSGPPCDVRTDRLGITLTWLSGEGRAFSDAPGVKVLDLPEGNKVERRGASIVVKSNGEASLNGGPFDTDYELMGSRLAMERSYDPGGGWVPVYVVADADATLGTLDEVLAAVPYGFEPRLAGWGKPNQLDIYQDQLREKGSVKKFETAVQGKDPSSRAVFMAETLKGAIGNQCAPLTVAFGSVAGIGDDTQRFMAREVPFALKECKCSVKDPDLIEYLMYSLAGAYERPQRWIPLQREHGPSMAAVSSLVQ